METSLLLSSSAPADFPGRLQSLRALRGMKQSTLALKVGVHEITVSRWERGRTRPTLRQQVRLCEELRVSFDELGLT
ncbi:MAG: helix-turn-helix transcriptional regulator, partial [Candidatus Dormibacteria bacterium]